MSVEKIDIMTKEDLTRIYSYMIFKFRGDDSFAFKKGEETIADNFMKRNAAATKKWLFEYLLFQFCRWHGVATRFGVGCFRVEWMLGRKAEAAFIERRSSWRRSYSDLLAKVCAKESDTADVKLVVASDMERARFFGTPDGFVNCVEYAFYDAASRFCAKCSYSNKCMEIRRCSL